MNSEMNWIKSTQERNRLVALATSNKSETTSDPIFTAITELAAAVCNAPIAGIGFFAQDKTWFKSTFGLGDLLELTTDISFWHHTLEIDQSFLEIKDLSQDPRSAAHSMVAGIPQLRFYAAISLITPMGHRIGSLHVLDYQSRILTAPQRASLKQVAVVVMQLLAARTAERHLTRLGRMLELSDDGICVMDAETLRFEYANENAQHYFGRSLLELLNLTPRQLQPVAEFAAFQEAIKPLYNNEKTFVDFETFCLRRDNTTFPAVARLQLWHDGARTKLLAAFKDVTIQRQAEQELAEHERHLRAVMEAVPECIKVVSPEGVLLEITPAGLEMLEADNLAQAQSQLLVDYLKPEYRDGFHELQAQIFQGLSARLEFEVLGLKGGHRWLETNAVPLRDESGNITNLLGATRDISERKRTEEMLRRQHAAMEGAMDGMAILNPNWEYLYLNKAHAQLFGYTDSAEYIGKTWKAFYDTTEIQRMEDEVFPILLSEGRWIGETVGTRCDGTQFAEGLSITVIDGGELVWVCHDISASKRAEQERGIAIQMAHLAQHDNLTGLPNRGLLMNRILQAIVLALQSDKKVAFLFIDLDNFKRVNDFLGHEAGDALLIEIAGRLQACVRESDTVCRQGGDEFLVLLSEVGSVNDIAHIAEKLLTACAEPHTLDGHEVHVGASIGISLYPDDGQDIDALSRNADAAMYHAKELGRNNFQFYNPTMNVRTSERFVLENNLRRALKHDEFVLYYQPMLDLATQSFIGCEALLRWQEPVRGLLLPGEFLPLIEISGLNVPINHWVLQEVCRQTKVWQSQGLNTVPVAVNLSAAQFKRRDFLSSVTEILANSGLDPHYLELELTKVL
jgi:diguanylate cyclase (GGDEF)-like protein/PAS domain S-box-containing protein